MDNIFHTKFKAIDIANITRHLINASNTHGTHFILEERFLRQILQTLHKDRVIFNSMRNFPYFIPSKNEGFYNITHDFIKHTILLNNAALHNNKSQYWTYIDCDTACNNTANELNKMEHFIVTNYINNYNNYDDEKRILLKTNFLDYIYNINIKNHVLLKNVFLNCIKKRIQHSLNIRSKKFKPWKLYSSKPIYPYMGILHFDPYDASYFNKRYIMPEDVGRIITEFVGYDFISNMHLCIFFENKGGRDNIRKEIENTLYSWNKYELLDFSYARPYNYIINKHTKKSNKHTKKSDFTISSNLTSKRGWTKKRIIDNLMNNINNKEIFYPFYRDVILLTPLLKKRRQTVKITNRNKTIALWRLRHAEKLRRAEVDNATST